MITLRTRIWGALLLLASFWPAASARAQVDPEVLAAEAARVEVVARASQYAVAIFSPGGQGGGSGVIISPDGYALSNFHVTHACGPVMKCGLADGVLYDAVIVGIDPTGDVALIKLLGRDDFPYAEMADSDRVQVGDWCFTIGNPFLLANDFQPSVAYGVISGTHRYQYPAGTILEYTDCLQADAAINPGNSGGPMFDAAGRLIGVNGRGSFEKRGRVNVGVGYAISINQIRNFLGHLKSGRIVDHATLGASMRSGDSRRVMVDDILDESDAFRRGMRYGDQLTSFAGREVTSVNAFKNILGIFPKGWRVPITFVHRGEVNETLVRLRGVHRDAELAEMVSDAPREDPNKAPNPAPDPNRRDSRRRREPPPRHVMEPAAPPEIPDAVKPYYVQKPDYVNYYFNQLHRDRVWKSLVSHGDYSALIGNWTIRSQGGEEVRFDLSDNKSSIKHPSGTLEIELSGSLAERQEPPGSGGLLVTLALWRRFLVQGPEKFGDVTYWGTAPLAGSEKLCDVLVGTCQNVECYFYVDSEQGQLLGMEMYPETETDPCELYFSEFREVQGRQFPRRIEVRYGEIAYQFTAGKRFAIEARAEAAP